MEIKGIIFDLDGTIIKLPSSFGWWLDVYNSALKEIGYEKGITFTELLQIQFGPNGNSMLESFGVTPEVFWESLHMHDKAVRNDFLNKGMITMFPDAEVIHN